MNGIRFTWLRRSLICLTAICFVPIVVVALVLDIACNVVGTTAEVCRDAGSEVASMCRDLKGAW